jgi:3-deoxy-D-manno-octulosonate 8-phosphate phosphatase (KDO 8-P phosphatase)
VPGPADGADDPLQAIPREIVERAKRIKLLVTDVDGVLTDGRVWYTADGGELQGFHIKDGLGMRLAMSGGIRVAMVTGRRSGANERRGQDIKGVVLLQGVRHKETAIRSLAESLGLERAEIACIGDDVNDFPAFDAAGLTFAPSDASSQAIARVDHILSRPGGMGAVREAVEILLRAQGKLDQAVAAFLEELRAEQSPP